jgi:hypothetical protein
MQEDAPVPLAEMVMDCTRRWFQDALKEARAGDAAMQVLVGQMYRSGYGVNKNEHKVSPPFLWLCSGFLWNLELKGAAFTKGLFLNS